MKIIVYDIECFSGCFLFCGLDIETGEVFSFELSRRKNELDSMIKFIESRKEYHFVGFNNLKYDSQVMEYIIRNNKGWFDLSSDQILKKIKYFSNEVIEGQDYEEWSPYRETSLSFKQIDLFKIHHFDNKARRASLKWVAFMIDAEDIEELPFPHYQLEFSDEELDNIVNYCWKDIANTHKFYQLTIGETSNEFYKGKNKIQDRLDLIQEFKFPEQSMNFSDVKIGDEINKRGYCSIKSIDDKRLFAIRKARKATRKLTFNNCIPEYVKFETPQLKKFLDDIKPVRVNMGDGTKQEFHLYFHGCHYVIARGGIHTKDPSRMIVPGKNEIMRDADVGSQHPTTIVKRGLYPDHLGPEWLINYKSTIVRRQEYKEKGKTDKRYKGLSDTYKLSLNGGGFGKTIDKTNWQYGPEVGYACTIGNQFEILMLVEMMELKGIKVVSANTDGILCLFDKNLEESYRAVCKRWEEIVGNTIDGKLEFTEFSLMAQESVGHYVAVETGGKLKIKGRFAVDGEVYKNNTKDIGRIERKALVDYFSKGIPPEDTIRNSRNIYDFFIGLKSTRDYHYETILDSKTEVYKRIIRYYVSKKGAKLLKIKNEDSDSNGVGMQRISDGSLVTIMNHKVDMQWDDYGIDYDYYIANCYRVMSRIEGKDYIYKNNKQLNLFG